MPVLTQITTDLLREYYFSELGACLYLALEPEATKKCLTFTLEIASMHEYSLAK